MKKRMMLITVIGMLTLLVFTSCVNNNMDQDEMNNENMKNNENMTEDMNNMENKEMIDNMEDDSMKEDDMDTHEGVMTNDGDLAETFELMDLSGNTVSLEALKGEKVYVKFWASWCSICLAGLEELDEFSAEEHDFKVITIVSPDYNGEKSTDKFKSWFDKQGADNLTVLLDEDGDIARAFGVRGYPTSAFIGSDGVLVQMFPGHLDSDVITEQFEMIY